MTNEPTEEDILENSAAYLKNVEQYSSILKDVSSVVGNVLAATRDDREGYHSLSVSTDSSKRGLEEELRRLEEEKTRVEHIVERLNSLNSFDVVSGEPV